MHFLFKLAVKNIFIKPKSIQYTYGNIKLNDKYKNKKKNKNKDKDNNNDNDNDNDKTLLESLYMGRVNNDEEFTNKSTKRKAGGR